MDPKIHREIYSYVIEKAPDLYFLLSPEGDILKANTCAQKITGRQLVGEKINDVIVDFTGTFILADQVAGDPVERILNVRNASGLPQSYYFSFKPIDDKILALGRLDAEELENMRTEILSLNQELNNLTRELKKKNSLLQLLNEEKNRFLGMAAHDLRKPIGLIITYSEFVIDEAQNDLNTEHLGFLNTINKSCAFMKRLVDDFLDVSAIEAGRFDVDLQPAFIRDVLDDSLRLNNLQAEKKGITLQVRCDDNIPRIWMDESKIEQVITNLVSNAIEHTQPESLVKIVLCCDKDRLSFSVADQGPGIPEAEQQNLFKPFVKTSAKKTGGEKSTGLGMLITRKIIEAHRGKIWVESVVGKGTTVKFDIPAAREQT